MVIPWIISISFKTSQGKKMCGQYEQWLLCSLSISKAAFPRTVITFVLPSSPAHSCGSFAQFQRFLSAVSVQQQCRYPSSGFKNSTTWLCDNDSNECLANSSKCNNDPKTEWRYVKRDTVISYLKLRIETLNRKYLKCILLTHLDSKRVFFFVKQQHFPSRKTNQIPENKCTKWSQNIYFISLNIGLN